MGGLLAGMVYAVRPPKEMGPPALKIADPLSKRKGLAGREPFGRDRLPATAQRHHAPDDGANDVYVTTDPGSCWRWSDPKEAAKEDKVAGKVTAKPVCCR